jgi:hypothetical protein
MGYLHPLNRASETDASQSGIEPSCTADEHSMQRVIRTALLYTIRNLNLYYYSEKIMFAIFTFLSVHPKHFSHSSINIKDFAACRDFD